MGDVVAGAMPIERRFAADMQAFEVSLQYHDTWMQGRRIVGAGINAARLPLQPACPDIMDSEIG